MFIFRQNDKEGLIMFMFTIIMVLSNMYSPVLGVYKENGDQSDFRRCELISKLNSKI